MAGTAGDLARSAADVRVTCPKKITPKDGGASAGVLMRSIGPPRMAVALRPDFGIVGPRAGEFSALRVKRGNDIVIEQTLAAGRRTRWPQDAAPLSAASNYDLELVPVSAEKKVVVVGIRADASVADETLTLVSAE